MQNILHILCCVFVLFFHVLCILCCNFLWIVQFWLPLQYALTFIYRWPWMCSVYRNQNPVFLSLFMTYHRIWVTLFRRLQFSWFLAYRRIRSRVLFFYNVMKSYFEHELPDGRRRYRSKSDFPFKSTLVHTRILIGVPKSML